MKLKLETWVNIATGIIALVSVVISIFALNVADEALDAQKEDDLRTHAASIYAVYNPDDNSIALSTTETDKKLNHVFMILPTDSGIKGIEFTLPNFKVKFDQIQQGIDRCIRNKVGEVNKKMRIRIPVGILTSSTHQGSAYESGNMYVLVVDYRTTNGQVEPDVEFVALANVAPIDMPAFIVFKWPWKTLPEPEIDNITFKRRTTDIRSLIDLYWRSAVVD